MRTAVLKQWPLLPVQRLLDWTRSSLLHYGICTFPAMTLHMYISLSVKSLWHLPGIQPQFPWCSVSSLVNIYYAISQLPVIRLQYYKSLQRKNMPWVLFLTSCPSQRTWRAEHLEGPVFFFFFVNVRVEPWALSAMKRLTFVFWSIASLFLTQFPIYHPDVSN